jgi:hypothetical protein
MRNFDWRVNAKVRAVVTCEKTDPRVNRRASTRQPTQLAEPSKPAIGRPIGVQKFSHHSFTAIPVGVQKDCHIAIFAAIEEHFTRMARIYYALLFLLARSAADELQKQIEFLKAENEILGTLVPKERIFLKPSQREKLLKLGKELGPAIRHVITIVNYSTFRRWVRKEEGYTKPMRKGRPRLPAIVRELAVMIAKETGWGYTRILGELRKLRVGPICRQSVKNTLIEHGLDPGPKRGKGTWSDFLRIHADTLWQCDFFSKRIWTLKGPRQIFAMAFIHLATRRVFVTPGTFKPDAGWMEKQGHLSRACRRRTAWLRDRHLRLRRKVLKSIRPGI